MIKMATTPIYGKKNPFKSLLNNQKANGIGTWYVVLVMYGLPSLSNYDSKLTLTYLTSRSKLLPNAFQQDFLKSYFL